MVKLFIKLKTQNKLINNTRLITHIILCCVMLYYIIFLPVLGLNSGPHAVWHVRYTSAIPLAFFCFCYQNAVLFMSPVSCDYKYIPPFLVCLLRWGLTSVLPGLTCNKSAQYLPLK
jgi:hypothetical protein